MKDQFWFCLHTQHKLDSDEEVTDLMDLLSEPGSFTAPSHFGAVEPVKKVLDASSKPEALAMLAGGERRNAGNIMLRNKDSNCLSWIRWHSTRTCTWQFFLDPSLLQTPKGLADTLTFFTKLCSRFPGLVGGGAPYEDWQAKHWRKVVSAGGAQGMQKIGFDYRGPITGIYWLTVLGTQAVAHFGTDRLQALPVYKCIDLGEGGLLLVLRPDPFASALDARLAQDRAIAAAIGSDYIFDIADADRQLKLVPGLG